MSWLSVLPRSNNKATCTCKQTNSQSRPHAHQLAAAHAWTHERTTNTCMGKQASRKQACAAETKTRNIEPQAHMRRGDINTSMRGHAVVTTVTMGLDRSAAPDGVSHTGLGRPAAPDGVPHTGLDRPAAPDGVPHTGLDRSVAPDGVPHTG